MSIIERVMPFRGIDTTRPYPPTGLSTARWVQEVDVEPVLFSTLVLTQTGVRIAPLFAGPADLNRRHDELPHVVDFNGTRYLEDGHHRVVRAAVAGSTGMLMRVFRVGERVGER